MRTRRHLLSWLAATTLVLPGAIVVATPAQAAGPALLPLTVTNNSGRSEPVHLYVLGVSGGRLGYVDAGGAFTPWTGGSLPPSPAPDVAIPGPANGASRTVHIPRGLSGRVYLSFRDKLDFRLTPDGLVQPAPWAAGDPNRDILFDWSELTYNDAGLWLNSSQVDMFAVPHAVTVQGADGVSRRAGELVPGGRNRVFDAIRDQPGWAGLIHTRADGTRLRALAPGKAAEAGLFDRGYLDGYLAEAWLTYRNTTLTVVPFEHSPGVRYFGRTDAAGEVLHFSDGAGRRVASFSRPSSADVWGCDGRLHAPNDPVVGPIARTLCAALHRSTLGYQHTQPTYDPAGFYRQPVTNHYSRIIHQHMVDGRAYGFAFDDVAAQESLVHHGDPRSAGIVLTPF